MKRILQIAVCAIIFWSCKKSETVDKNELVSSNIAQYSFGEQNFTTATFKLLSIPTTKDTADNSAWIVYLYYQTLDRWYVVPGLGVGAATNYRLSYDFKNEHVNFYIDKVGAGEKYEKARIVRIYSRNQQLIGKLRDDPQAVAEMIITK
ncbi:hypothetical protein GFS24_11505 [Chitinophaga sp. SYP-B3965]|uniref:hypothetical protein n=1 Tax=Chitinophaga sp. SYP-B3965 TaxID=2663120 RepID=UPI001299A10A|nr:hypothetical protein [Chitinophaga sp. SYP-B3965]MRG45746.1 hypothetical protein [Chitinophaga sp. SYP-B3965]